MKYSLYIDDIRTPKFHAPIGRWVIARSYIEVLFAIHKHGVPTHISFDHDLGIHENAMTIAKNIIESDQSYIEKHNEPFLPLDFTFNVHSANPVGRINIESLMNNYLDFRNKKLKER